MPPTGASFERKSVAIVGLGSIGGVVAGLLSTIDRYDSWPVSGARSSD